MIDKNTIIQKVEKIDLSKWKKYDKEKVIDDEIQELIETLVKEKKENLLELSNSQVKLYDNKQLTMKLAGNSQFGAQVTVGFRLYNPHVGEAITSQGVEIIKLTQDVVESLNYEVIYGDTDSMFIKLDEHIPDEIKLKGDDAVKEYILKEIVPNIYKHINEALDKLAEDVGILPYRKHYFEMKQEMIGRKMLLLQDRAGKGFAKKRYLIHVVDEEGVSTDKIKAVGVEIRRSELPKFIKTRLWKFVEGFMKDTMTKEEILNYLMQVRDEIFQEVEKKNIHNVGRLLSVKVELEYKDCERSQQCYGTKIWNEIIATKFNVPLIEAGQKVLIVPIKLKDMPETNDETLLELYQLYKQNKKDFFVFNPIVEIEKIKDIFSIFNLDKDSIIEKMFYNQITPYLNALNISEDSLRFGLTGINIDELI